MLAPHLRGGLGNQLFQLAAAETLARESDRTLCMLEHESPKTHHTDIEYFTTIFSEFTKCPLLPAPYATLEELSFRRGYLNGYEVPNVCFRGYFQNWEYVSASFKDRLRLPPTEPTDTVFLHIRGGDFVNNKLHYVDLGEYYQRAIQHFPKGTRFSVCTNDVPFAKSMKFLEDLDHHFVEADEVTTLSLMASCSRGGICANSSFSWWGAFLNPSRTLVMPDKWFNDPEFYIEGYFFPGVIRIPV